MIVLLPPSETKATRTRGAHLDLGRLTWPELTSPRSRLIAAVEALSERDDAASVLGVSPNLADQIAWNTALTTSPALPASALYHGVLYDALDLHSLGGADKARAGRRIVISSALYGALRLRDRVAPYRLSMAVNVPGIGPLAAYWKAQLDAPLTHACGSGLVVDVRSSTYAASWTPTGDLAQRWVHIRVPGATHMAKHTRGLLTRFLVTHAEDPRTPQQLARHAGSAFDVSLQEPRTARAPWVLNVSTRP